MSIKDVHFVVAGTGRIKDGEINLLEYIPNLGIPIQTVPKSLTFSEKINGTSYDVSAFFDTNSKHSILQQFKNLIISQN